MDKKIFNNDLEKIYLSSLSSGYNNINNLKSKLSCISTETFAKITQSLYFKMLINIKENKIFIDKKMKILVDYIILNRIETINYSSMQEIVYQIKKNYEIDVTRELIILIS